MASDLCGKIEIDIDIKASAGQFHHMFMHKLDSIHTTTESVHACELHDGEWGIVGSTIVWNYTHDGKPKTTKEIIEAINEEKNSITFKVIEGDLTEHYKEIRIIVQATPKPEGSKGCIVRWILDYEKHHGDNLDPHTFADFLREISKDLDVHLLQEINDQI